MATTFHIPFRQNARFLDSVAADSIISRLPGHDQPGLDEVSRLVLTLKRILSLFEEGLEGVLG